MEQFKNNTGQSLLEVLVSLGAATIIVGAIVVAVVNALNNVQYSKNQNLATQYAQEAMEIVRKMRDTNIATFDALNNPSYCLDKSDTVLSNGPGADDDRKNTGIPVGCQRTGTPNNGNLNVDNFFAREIQFGSCSTGREITAVVSWADGKCATSNHCHRVELKTCLTNFNVVPTP